MSSSSSTSPRLAAIVDALPLTPGMRVLEIGGAPGVAAREICRRLPDVHVLVVDRSERGVVLTRRACAAEIADGRLEVRCVAAEDLVLDPDEQRYDLAFAVRVGALDGRHPQTGRRVLERLAVALTPTARLFIDGGDPLRELDLPR